jgi:hypothetical protein
LGGRGGLRRFFAVFEKEKVRIVIIFFGKKLLSLVFERRKNTAQSDISYYLFWKEISKLCCLISGAGT